MLGDAGVEDEFGGGAGEGPLDWIEIGRIGAQCCGEEEECETSH